MVEDGDAARKRAADCMTLATKASSDERRDMLRAMARSWATLANQMDRLDATSVSVRSDARPATTPVNGSNGTKKPRKPRNNNRKLFGAP